jgi:hypothetical protein
MSRFWPLGLPLLLLLFLFLFLPREEDANPLQINAHSGAIPKSCSSSESQLHGGAGLGVAFFACDGTEDGTNTNGETRCLMSDIGVTLYIIMRAL